MFGIFQFPLSMEIYDCWDNNDDSDGKKSMQKKAIN